MTGPKTLLEMSGAPLTPSALSQAAVISIDCQNESVTGPTARALFVWRMSKAAPCC